MSQNSNATDLDIKHVTEQAHALADILKSHGVFGAVDEDIEARDFISMVEKHALSKEHNELEITYRITNVRLLVRTQIIANTGIISRIRCFDHPSENPKIDYKKLSDECNLMLLGW